MPGVEPLTQDLSSALPADILDTAFLHAPAGVGVCDEDGRFVAVNDSLARLLKLRRDQIVGRPFVAFMHPEERTTSSARYFSSVVAAASDAARRPGRSEVRCLAGDGAVIWLAVSWTITSPDARDHQYGIVHLSDITERKAIERDLAAGQLRFQLAFDCAPIGIAVVGLDGRFLQANRALQSALGYSEAQLREMTFAEVSHPNDRADSMAVFDQLRNGDLEVHETVKRYRHRDGHTVYARRVAAAARHRDGSADYVLVQIENITAERLATDQLNELAVRDQLTGLATRDTFARQLHLSNAARTLVLVELDELSRLTSALGRPVTDHLLVKVAQRLATCCRDSDVLARLGDGNFAILIHDADTTTGSTIATRIFTALAAPVRVGRATPTVTAHVGIAADPSGTQALDAMLQHASLALQSGKADTGRTWATYHPRMMTTSARQLALEADLWHDLNAGKLSLAYQPILDLADGTVRSVEALCRWQHDALGTISPEEFITLAERSNTIHRLTRWSLRTACTDLARWRAGQRAAPDLGVAVNISALSFAQPDFPTIVSDCLANSRLPAHHLILEITETALANDEATTLANAQLLRSLGVRLALDDFGTGYSSLSRLAELPITDLKLDRALTDVSTNPEVTAAMISACVHMANELNLTVIAEGIETQIQLDLLRRAGCPQGQGFLLALPQPASKLGELVTQRL